MTKIAIVGTRGIPAKYGGFETFAQELSVRLAVKGYDVEVYCNHIDNVKTDYYNGVRVVYAKTSKDISPFKYYFETINSATNAGNDIILSCGQGGALAIGLLRLLRRHPIYVTNTDGVEHKRTKWNIFVRLAVRFLGEFSSILFSNYLVADSKGIKKYLLKSYKILNPDKLHMIEYGAFVENKTDYNIDIESLYNIQKDNYYLVVSRLEPENNVQMIIEGYLKSSTKKPLVVVGGLKDSSYVKMLLKYRSNNVIFLDGIYNPQHLTSLRLFAHAYLHGHSVGGTNPSLLEALGCGNIVIGHDNIFNREVTDNKMFYFDTPISCANSINIVDNITDAEKKQLKAIAQSRITEYYNWDRIADEYVKMFESLH